MGTTTGSKAKQADAGEGRDAREAPEPREAGWHDADELRWAARHWATRLGVKVARIQLRQMSSKWASISTAGRLTLNTDLVAVPQPLGEFVIVHELVHLLAPNHGRVFKSFMHAYLPDWHAREKALKQYSRGSKQRLGTHSRGWGCTKGDIPQAP